MKMCDFRQEEKNFVLMGKSGVEQLELQTMSSGEETRLKIGSSLAVVVHGDSRVPPDE